jgi:hypothetical protein
MTRRQDNDPEMLVIDRAAAAEIPTTDAIQEWAREKRGFISRLNTDDREGHQQTFLDEIRVFHVAPQFNSPEDLQSQIEDRLKMIAAEDLAP